MLQIKQAVASVHERYREPKGVWHEGERVVVVSHGASIIACLTDAMQLEAGHLRLLPYYTSISILRVLGDRRMVGTFGDVAHVLTNLDHGSRELVAQRQWRLDPLPLHRAGLRVALRSLDVLSDAVAILLAHEPSALELHWPVVSGPTVRLANADITGTFGVKCLVQAGTHLMIVRWRQDGYVRQGAQSGNVLRALVAGA